MNKRKKDPRFDDGASVRPDFRDSGRSIQPRKMAQLCTQVRRALELALMGVVQDDALLDVEVFDVAPTQDPARLRVTFVAHGAGPDIPDLTARLELARGLLTAEVAQAITRKRVPDLVFEVVPATDGPAT